MLCGSQINRMGVRGWANGRYGLDRVLYLLHRLTGLGLLAFLLLHLFVTSSRLSGQKAWEATMSLLANPFFLLLEYLVFCAFLFHALNGLRLILAEFGWSLGRPGQPIYPYPNSLRRQNKIIFVLALLFLAVAVVGAADLIGG